MLRTPVSSTSIRAIGYDKITGTLEIEFIGGQVYQYLEVPEDEYVSFMAAGSKGKHFHSNIKDSYQFEQV